MMTVEEYRKDFELAKTMTDEECLQIIKLRDQLLDIIFDRIIREMKEKKAKEVIK